MSSNGNRVTTRQFYEALREMDGRINRRLDRLLESQTRVTTIAETHEGRIWVENNADTPGASFHMEIIGNAGDKA